MSEEHWARSYILESNEARIVLLKCSICGAAILLDGADDPSAAVLHIEWHKGEDSSETTEGEE